MMKEVDFASVSLLSYVGYPWPKLNSSCATSFWLIVASSTPSTHHLNQVSQSFLSINSLLATG